MKLPPIGSDVKDLDTPCLLVDLDLLEHNIAQMSRYCRERGVAWRPHAKCHKSPAIARRVLDAGAIGVTCAKLGEAEVMASGGITDILIANQLVGKHKLARLVELRRRADPIVIVDHPTHVEALAAAATAGGICLRTMVEVDIGMKRCGTPPGEPTVELARRVAAAPSLELVGAMAYEGHLLTIADPEEKEQRIRSSIALLIETAGAIRQAGLPCPMVSAGGTGSFHYTAQIDGVTEIQAGGGIFMDVFYRKLCTVTDLQFAFTVLTTVTARPGPHRVITDAGRKTLNRELQMPEVRNHPELEVTELSAEHGWIAVISGPGPAIGERLELLPGYVDFTTVLHNQAFGVRNGRLEEIFLTEARGRVD